jgi:hypothetical protein
MSLLRSITSPVPVAHCLRQLSGSLAERARPRRLDRAARSEVAGILKAFGQRKARTGLRSASRPCRRHIAFTKDNCRIHCSNVIEEFIAKNHISRVPQPPSSPDLTPLGFWLFGHLKNSLAGWMFEDPQELLDGIMSFLREVQPSELHIVFSPCVERVRWVLENNGDSHHE